MMNSFFISRLHIKKLAHPIMDELIQNYFKQPIIKEKSLF
jgi:hypothetical protein